MTQPPRQDPAQPGVTFDYYIIPESVTKAPTRPPVGQLRGVVIAVSAMIGLAFILGVVATLRFTGPGDTPQFAQITAPEIMSQSAPVVEETVTRQTPTDLLSTATTIQKPTDVPALQAAVLQGLQPQRTVGKLTEAEKEIKAREAIDIVSRNKMRMLREGVLAGVYTVRTKTKNGQRRLVLETVNADMTQGNMADLLRAAAARGEIAIPASLSTADGDVDMDTMLFNLVQTSLANDGTEEGAEAAREMSRRAFAASDAKTKEVRGERIYIVEPGDSLAYISLQFYGRPNAYMKIFEANRSALSSPDMIKIGQRLIIPG